MPVGRPRPSRRGPALDDRAARVRALAERVEEDVGGDLERARHRERAVAGVARVAERLRAELELAVVEDRLGGRDDALLQRGHRGDRLERRAGRIGRRDRAVEQRRAALLRVELVEALLRQRLGEHVGVEARVGAERQHLAVHRVQRHVGARLGGVAVAVGGRDRGLERVVGGALEVEVERQAQALALLGLAARDLAAVVAVAERVDDDARVAVLAAQVAVVGLLDAVLADAGAGGDAAVALLLELLRRDLAQRAEQLGGELVVRIGAQEQLLDRDAGELVLALLEVVEGGARHVGLDRHVGVGRLGDAVDDAPVDRARRHVEHAAEAAERAPQLGRLRRHRRHGDGLGAPRGAGEAPVLAALGAAVAALLLAAAALERAQLVGGREPALLGRAARAPVGVGDLELGLGQPARARSGRPAPRACARAGCRRGRRCRRAAPRS